MMTPEHSARLRRLPQDVRDLVLERACLRHEACPGLTWEQADEEAYDEVMGVRQRSLVLGGGE